jgi:cellulose synthase/poly-beta-1,6-N-acetylglucosamine synthase-like glycosyltransferase
MTTETATRPSPTASRSDLVSVVIPTLNEERSLEACLDSVLAQSHENLEALVVDGRSTDRTRDMVAIYAAADERVRLVDNPGQSAPAALNVAARAMRSDWFIRVDAHSTVRPSYVEQALAHLRSAKWGGVGGRKDAVGSTDAGLAIAAALGSRFGVGNSTYHYGTEAQVVDHIPFGAYPRAVIEEVGGWDESLPTNEDYEFDHRVRAAGHELLFDPDMVIDWECRQSVTALFRQYRRYGRGKASVVRMHPTSTKARHLAAPGLVALLATSAAVSPRKAGVAALMAAPYVATLATASALTAPQLDGPAKRYLPAAFAAMHLGWGLGFWEGMAGHASIHQDESIGGAPLR